MFNKESKRLQRCDLQSGWIKIWGIKKWRHAPRSRRSGSFLTSIVMVQIILDVNPDRGEWGGKIFLWRYYKHPGFSFILSLLLSFICQHEKTNMVSKTILFDDKYRAICWPFWRVCLPFLVFSKPKLFYEIDHFWNFLYYKFWCLVLWNWPRLGYKTWFFLWEN